MRTHHKPLLVAMSLLLGEPAGSQRLVVEAMSSSGEIVNRKEINFNGAPRGQSFFVVLAQPAARRGQSFPNRRNANVLRKTASRAGDRTRSASSRKALLIDMLPRTRQSGLDLVVSRQ